MFGDSTKLGALSEGDWVVFDQSNLKGLWRIVSIFTSLGQKQAIVCPIGRQNHTGVSQSEVVQKLDTESVEKSLQEVMEASWERDVRKGFWKKEDAPFKVFVNLDSSGDCIFEAEIDVEKKRASFKATSVPKSTPSKALIDLLSEWGGVIDRFIPLA